MPRKKKVVLTEEQVKELIHLYEQGMPVRDIMKMFNIRGYAAFYRILESHNVPKRRKKRGGRRIPEEVRKKICELRAKGWSYPRIAKELGISLGSAYRHSKKCEESQ